MTPMICPYDEQQCEYPGCVKEGTIRFNPRCRAAFDGTHPAQKEEPAAATHITEASRERDYFTELRDKTFEKARADGMEIIIPTSRQLSLDIDRPWPHDLSPRLDRHVDGQERIQAVRSLITGVAGKPSQKAKLRAFILKLDDEFSIRAHEAWRSRGGNIHVMLTLGRDLDPITRIALQSMLGSDPMRELLNLRRVLCGADDPIALFRPSVAGESANV